MTDQRPSSLVAATVMLVLSGIMNLIPYDLFLSYGPDDDRPPKVVMYGAFILGALMLAAAYAVWKRQRWGMYVGLIATVIAIVSSLPGVFFAPTTLIKVGAGAGVVLGIAVIYTLLMQSTRRSYAS